MEEFWGRGGREKRDVKRAGWKVNLDVMGIIKCNVTRTVFFWKGNRDIVFVGVLLRLGVLN